MQRPRKYKIELAERICEDYAKGMYTIESCCRAHGVEPSTFRCWAASTVEDVNELSAERRKKVVKRGFIPEINAMYKEAKKESYREFMRIVLEAARASLIKLITGYYVIETETITRYYENDTYVTIKVTERYIPPHPAAIIFALKSFYPHIFR